MNYNSDLEIIIKVCKTYDTSKLDNLSNEMRKFLIYICNYLDKYKLKKVYLIDNNIVNYELSNIILNRLNKSVMKSYYVCGLNELNIYSKLDKNILLLKGIDDIYYKRMKYPDKYIDRIKFIFEQLNNASTLVTFIFDYSTLLLNYDFPFIENVSYKYINVINFYSNFIININKLLNNKLKLDIFNASLYNNIINNDVQKMLSSDDNFRKTILNLIFKDNINYEKLKNSKKDIYDNIYNYCSRIINYDNNYNYEKLKNILHDMYNNVKMNKNIKNELDELNKYYKYYKYYFNQIIVFKNINDIIPVDNIIDNTGNDKFRTIFLYTNNDDIYEFYKYLLLYTRHSNLIKTIKPYKNDEYKYTLQFDINKIIESDIGYQI
jgi:hypothetical protein